MWIVLSDGSTVVNSDAIGRIVVDEGVIESFARYADETCDWSFATLGTYSPKNGELIFDHLCSALGRNAFIYRMPSDHESVIGRE